MRHSRRIDSSEVQGEGSYIVMRTMSRGERKALGAVAERGEQGEELDRLGDEMIVSCLRAWNWTDAAGQELPLPRATADLDELSDEECTFLFKALYEASYPSDEEKNS